MIRALRPLPRQSGAVLLVSLILLIVATTISLSAVSTSIMELRMAGNAEASMDAMQTALAAVDFTIADPDHLPTSGPLLVPAPVNLTESLFDTGAGDSITATATRLQDCAPPPRARSGSSLTAFSAFAYEITADVNRNQSGQGRGTVAQGYILLGPKC